MEISISNLVGKVRIAIDEIVADRSDDFSKDADTEIAQAISHAATQVMTSLPEDMLVPKAVDASVFNNGSETDHISKTDGSGHIVLPADFIRLIEFKLMSWATSVHEVMNPQSDEAKRQGSRWSRGTPQKPKVMLSADVLGNKILQYWTAGRYDTNSAYNHQVDKLLYVPNAKVNGDTITVNIKEAAENAIIYTAAGIFLEGKKEGQLAERMYAVAAALQQR